MKFIDRTGEIRKNKESLGGYEMKIVEYNNALDIVVEFQDEYKAKVHARYQEFKNGTIKNPYQKSVFSVGYLGEGECNESTHRKIYRQWCAMLQRCYDPYYLDRKPTYRNCIVCEEWLCFQNFAKWYEENYYECNGEKMHVDKDVLNKGNKIYSPETCIFVPERINSLFVKCNASRGKYPIGVHWKKETNKFIAQCNILDDNKKTKKKNLGSYNTIFQAFTVYKNFKEKYIKQVADEYIDLIPKKLYSALYSWEVEIND